MLDDILAFEIDDEKILKDISCGKIVKINKRNMPKSLKLSDNKLYLLTNNEVIVSLGKFNGTFFKPKKVFV